MNKKILSLFMFGFFILAMGFVNAEDVNDTMVVKANVLKSVVSISVPDEVIFQDIAKGYISERIDLDILNIGTIDVSVTPELTIGYNESVFDYISFRNVLTDDLMKIRYFDFEIVKPDTVGGEKIEDIYMYLDLEEYAGEIEIDMIDHQTEIVFWAVPL